MKKIAILLCCVFSAMLLFTGCSRKEATAPKVSGRIVNNVPEVVKMVATDYPESDMTEQEQAKILAYDFDEWTDYQATLRSQDVPLKFKNQSVYAKAVDSYSKCVEESGNINKIGLIYVNTSKDGYEVSVEFSGSQRNGKISISYDETMTITNVAFNADHGFGENMGKAGLNTLMGMGVVFTVLILISLIISLFGLIPKFQKRKSEKKVENNSTSSVDQTIAQIIEKEESELSDDLELVAVISAAIAAYEGSAATEGFVVRSIKKSKNWQNAGY